jgi:hypothetical protein
MKKFAATLYRKLLTPSMRFELRETVAWLRELGRRARLWNWEIAYLPLPEDSPYDIHYVGRKNLREFARILLGIERVIDTRQAKDNQSKRKVLVSEMPIPGALYVPLHLGAIVPLGRPIEEIMAGYDSELRRLLRNHLARYHLQQVTSDAEIERADREMLRPFAMARHGSSAIQVSPDLVRQYARNFGRLDFVLLGEEVVGCQLAQAYIRRRKRYWCIHRFGFTEEVFSDHKRLREANSISSHLELEWAIKNGFDYFDMGASFARPNEGRLQWKRRRGGELDIRAFHQYFYVRLPGVGAAQFLWNSPLFAIEQHKLTLHLGLPVGPNDDEVKNHYREMGFGGLEKVYLHCARTPGEPLLEMLRSFYAHQKSPPILESILST